MPEPLDSFLFSADTKDMQDGNNIPRGLVKIAKLATDKGTLMPLAAQPNHNTFEIISDALWVGI